ncbi:unnamed protein product [Lymnaea stagnalis]|uniref:Ubiquitin-like domain-containing protein n=1 Tax=Lymnaea stagnalis TaxID=6523 RepID=A0AAV2H2U9_LYMST
MSDYRGRGSRGGGRGRGRGMPRGGPRGSSRGGYSSEREGGRGGYRGRGDGFSRGRGGPPRHLSRDDDSPPRKVPMMSRSYDSDRGRGPPLGRRGDRNDDSYDRIPSGRSRDPYPSPPRDTSRILDRLSPPPRRDRDYGSGSRGDYLPSSRSYSLTRDTGSYRESYSTNLREDRRDSFSRPSVRDYASPRGAGGDFATERSRDFRDSPRDYGASRDYPPRSSDFRDLGRDFRDGPPRDRLSHRHFDGDRSFSPKGGVLIESRSGGPPSRRGAPFDNRSGGPIEGRDHNHGGDRDYNSSRFSSRTEDRISSRGPPREYSGRGGPRGSMRGGRDDRGRGSFMNACCTDLLYAGDSHGLDLIKSDGNEVSIKDDFYDQRWAVSVCDKMKANSDLGSNLNQGELFLMINYKKTTIFTDVTESTTVGELKRIIAAILKSPSQYMMLYKGETLLAQDHKTLSYYGYTMSVAKAYSPDIVTLVLTLD